MVHASDHSTENVEAEGLQVQGQLKLQIIVKLKIKLSKLEVIGYLNLNEPVW